MGRWSRWWVAGLAYGMLGCGGGDKPASPDESTPRVEIEGDSIDVVPADWAAPACGEGADLDEVAGYSGGQLRLCVREAEVRLWGLDGGGRPDPAFVKGDAEVRFTPEGGTEQMVSGIILKGDAAGGFATR
ncbi:MAG: hypothetical protein QGH45_20375, partial [Myxococcota bacterium]|nr:hypothetical protein [Myxococcota bacterium]